MNPYRQTADRVLPGETVGINIGLGPPRYGAPRRLVESAGPLLSEVLKPGFKAEMQPPTTEDDEATIVVTGVLNSESNLTPAVYHLAERCGQDCIAVYYPSIKRGVLIGPHADDWGDFDLALFKLPKEIPC